MAIEIEEVNRIAKLARLVFNDQEKQKLQQELSAILEYVDQLKQVEGSGGSEVVDLRSVNLMRDDVAEPTPSAEEFLKQAPDRLGDFVKVKSILE